MLPQLFLPLILAFRPLFSSRVWSSALVLLVGAILAPGKRTVSAILRVMGLAQEKQFQRYHRVLNRAIWSSRHASCILLNLNLLFISFHKTKGDSIITSKCSIYSNAFSHYHYQLTQFCNILKK